jgi:hypothetical protein
MHSQQRIGQQVARGARLRLVQRKGLRQPETFLGRPSFFSDATEKRQLSIVADAGMHTEHSYPRSHHQYSSKSYFHASPFYQQRPTGSVLSSAAAQSSAMDSNNSSPPAGSDQDVTNQHVERFAAQCMSQLLPRYHEYSDFRNARELSTLDLELGSHEDASTWDDPWEADQVAQEERIEEEEAGYPTEHDTEQLPERNDPNGNDFSFRKRKPSGTDLLLEFDPENPPSTDDPEALQLWLECDAQQEAVQKYQKVIDSARDRKDYSSLSLVQRQVLRWFQPLKEEIASRQKNYILKEGNTNAKAAKRYGPYLCTLPPEKLAVIAAHEAIMHALMKSGADGRGGVPFVSMAERIGEAVEEEVLIHRLLHKRFKDGQLKMREDEDTALFDNSDTAEEDDTAEEGATEESFLSDTPDAAVDELNSLGATHKWAYAPSHLRTYMEEISQNEPNAKKRRVVAYAIRRARQILEKDEVWSTRDKVQLGAALFQVLLEKATIMQDGKEEMAFTYEKRWFQKDKTRYYVSLNEGLYKMVVSDKLQSFGATTTKHKPMILPPKPWTEFNDGGYLWLKVDLMRFHGCNTQKVRSRMSTRLSFSFATYLGTMITHTSQICLNGPGSIAKRRLEHSV